MKKNKRRIVVKGESQIVEVYVELEGGILITVDKKYFSFYLPDNPKDDKNISYQFMTAIPIAVEMELVKAIMEEKTEAFKKALLKGQIKIPSITRVELETVN